MIYDIYVWYCSVQNILSSHLLSKSSKIRIYKTIILAVILYGCETWSLTLREEHRRREFRNRVLHRIFGPRRDDVTQACRMLLRRIFGLMGDEVMVGWRKLHNEELQDLYSLPSIFRTLKSRRMKYVGHVAQIGEEKEGI
jgi:hypothetical protein